MGMAMNIKKPMMNGRLNMTPAVDSLFTHDLKVNGSLTFFGMLDKRFPSSLSFYKKREPWGSLPLQPRGWL